MKQVFIIDDNQDIKDLMKLILSREGFGLSFATDGSDALTQIERGLRPDLILLDHNMPVMDGNEFLIELEKQYPEILTNVPIVMMTAINQDLVAKNKATALVRKPSGIKEIVGLVNQYFN